MSLQFATVAATLAKLEVAGLVWKDIDEIPAEVGQRGKSFMIPLPNIITDFSMVRDSFGGGSSAKMTVTYYVNYRLCYEPVGTNRGMTLKVYDGLTKMIGLILDEILAIDVFNTSYTEIVDIVPMSVTNFGIVNDPADNAFFGADFAFMVTEFVN
jgi:hypothetical protein